MSWKKLASAFVTFDEPSAEKADPNQPIKTQLSNPDNTSTPAVKSYTPAATNIPNYAPVYSNGPAVNPEAKQHLLSLIKANNLDGIDYCEYSVQLEIAKSWPIAIEQKYQSSFAALKGQAELSKQDFNKEKLVTSAGFYKTIIEKAIKDFEVEFDQTYKEEVEDNKALIQIKAKRMQELSEEMAKLNSEIQQLNIQVAQSESQLKVNKDMFVNTGNAVLTEIDEEISKINLYIS